ncbi:50S ribosomal protein L24 [mine drainage metagenome]|uniref:50S ribosomal protein L24 n=1 Tax=mine drainage metagenome TaxID=410659 RepID=A0A1J5PPV1_9ZZZZ
MNKIRKGDNVIVITGKDKGKRGTVLAVREDNRLMVEGVNTVKKHVKPNPVKGDAGGVVVKEMPIQISNVALFNAATQRADRVGFKILEDGRKVRVYKSTNEVVDI